MDIITEVNKCYGCSACMNICPKGAIKMLPNDKGFLYPKIDSNLCVNCNMCKNVCPSENEILHNKYNQKFYALKNKDNGVRENSSSGGVYHELIQYVLNKNGTCYGAVFNKDLSVVHSRGTTVEECNKQKGAKYVQSTIGMIYKDVKKDLLNNKVVLFSGTPCEVQGLKNYLINIDTTNLILCDIICHGVPSPLIYNTYIKGIEKRYKSKVIEINFRKKDKTYGIKNMLFKLEDGRKVFIPSYYDTFYHLFDNELILRESCYTCEFSKSERVGDISIGDFWGIEKLNSTFNDNYGVSLAIINSKKGEEIFSNINNNFKVIESTIKLAQQPSLVHPTLKNKNYNRFWKEFNGRNLDDLDLKYSDRNQFKKVISRFLNFTGIKFTLNKIKKKEMIINE